MPPRNAARRNTEGRKMDMLTRLKTLDIERESEMEELLGLAAYAEMLSVQYTTNGIPMPDWLK